MDLGLAPGKALVLLATSTRYWPSVLCRSMIRPGLTFGAILAHEQDLGLLRSRSPWWRGHQFCATSDAQGNVAGFSELIWFLYNYLPRSGSLKSDTLKRTE